MFEALSLTSPRRATLAIACIALAALISLVLLTRLPHASQPVPFFWTLQTVLMVGSFCMAGAWLGSTVDGWMTTLASRLITAGCCGLITSLAVLATAIHASPLVLACDLLLAVMTVAAPISWVLHQEETRLAKAGSTETASPHTAPPQNAPAQTEPVSAAPETLRWPTQPAAVQTPVALQEEEAQHDLPPHVDQTLQRYTMDDRDQLEVCLRLRFEPGQQTAIAHVPIQPAMTSIPEVECEPVSGDDLRLTVDPVHPYGVRLVCKRPAPWDSSSEAVVALLISAARSSARAA